MLINKDPKVVSLVSDVALIRGTANNVLPISTMPSHSSAAMGTQSNNSCQMHVTPATISVATREAAAPTWFIVLQKQQTLDGWKKEEKLRSEKFTERMQIWKG